MQTYCFSAGRQLFFHVNIGGQQRLVKFGDRDAFGASIFQTMVKETAEAIRRHSLYRRGIIREQVKEEPKAAQEKPATASSARTKVTARPATKEKAKTAVAEKPVKPAPKKEILEARNFTQAKSMLAKKLGISYSDIKTPALMMDRAKQAGIEIVYKS